VASQHYAAHTSAWGETWTPVAVTGDPDMKKNLRRLGAALATAILAVGVLGTAPANARDTTWGGDSARSVSSSD